MSETLPGNTLLKEAMLREAMLFNNALLEIGEGQANEPLLVIITNNSNSDLTVEPGSYMIPSMTQGYEVQHRFDIPLFIMTVEEDEQMDITLDSVYGYDLSYEKLMNEVLWTLTFKSVEGEALLVGKEEIRAEVESSGGPNVTIGGNG